MSLFLEVGALVCLSLGKELCEFSGSTESKRVRWEDPEEGSGDERLDSEEWELQGRKRHRILQVKKPNSKWRFEEFSVVCVMQNPPLTSLQNLQETKSHCCWDVSRSFLESVKSDWALSEGNREKPAWGLQVTVDHSCYSRCTILLAAHTHPHTHTHTPTQSCRDPPPQCVNVCVCLCVQYTSLIHLMHVHNCIDPHSHAFGIFILLPGFVQ